MIYESDAFISYAHLDNLPLIEGGRGWVEDFHRALEVRIGELRGREPEIWRDKKLQGNDFFADTLCERLGRVAVLISILSPPYIHSEWTRRELAEFCKAAAQCGGGIRIQDKSRVFKVIKSPIPLDEQPPEIQPLLGYEFFKEDPNTGKVKELNRAYGKEAELEFLMRLDDLAHEICALLKYLDVDNDLPSEAQPLQDKAIVYLAETTADLREERDSIRRELQQHGYTVLPAFSLPVFGPMLESTVREQLDRCELSIHLVGKHYSFVPEAWPKSLVEIQNDLAIERTAKGGFSRLVWIPPGLEVKDERQRNLINHLRMNPKIEAGSDLLEIPLEALKTAIQNRLHAIETQPAPVEEQPGSPEEITHLYLIHDKRDQDAIQPWKQYLFQQKMEVLTPDFEGTPAEVRHNHQENLRNCDAVLIYHGVASQSWLNSELREVRKSPGYGRTAPLRAVGVTLAPPHTPQKECFQSHEAIVIPQLDGFMPDLLTPFVLQAKKLPNTQASK